MTRILMGLLATCVGLGLAAPAVSAEPVAKPKAGTLARPCAALEGHRWVAYVEPTDGTYLSAEYWDLRHGVVDGPGINGKAGRPYPNPIKGTMPWGHAAITKFTACVNHNGAARLSAAWAAEPIYDVTLSADGLTATIAGTNTRVDTTNLRGWAARAPN
jgi:hypothetical protein